jgi:hypothetical protein
VAKLGIRLNTSNGGLSQISGWDFNSFAVLAGFPYATNSGEGVCKLCGDFDNTRKINSLITTPYGDYSLGHNKRIRRLYVSGYTSGSITIEQKTEYDSHVEDVIIPEYHSNAWCKSTRKMQGVNWQFIIKNVNGCDFAIRNLSVLFVVLTRSRGK